MGGNSSSPRTANDEEAKDEAKDVSETGPDVPTKDGPEEEGHAESSTTRREAEKIMAPNTKAAKRATEAERRIQEKEERSKLKQLEIDKRKEENFKAQTKKEQTRLRAKEGQLKEREAKAKANELGRQLAEMNKAKAKKAKEDEARLRKEAARKNKEDQLEEARRKKEESAKAKAEKEANRKAENDERQKEKAAAEATKTEAEARLQAERDAAAEIKAEEDAKTKASADQTSEIAKMLQERKKDAASKEKAAKEAERKAEKEAALEAEKERKDAARARDAERKKEKLDLKAEKAKAKAEMHRLDSHASSQQPDESQSKAELLHESDESGVEGSLEEGPREEKSATDLAADKARRAGVLERARLKLAVARAKPEKNFVWKPKERGKKGAPPTLSFAGNLTERERIEAKLAERAAERNKAAAAARGPLLQDREVTPRSDRRTQSLDSRPPKGKSAEGSGMTAVRKPRINRRIASAPPEEPKGTRI